MAAKRWTFMCSGCKKEHEYGSYAIAQIASGHTLTFNGCDCEAETTLTRRKMDRDARGRGRVMTGLGFMYASEAERAAMGWLVTGAFVMMVVVAMWYALDRRSR